MNYKNIYRTVQVCSSGIQSLHFFKIYKRKSCKFTSFWFNRGRGYFHVLRSRQTRHLPRFRRFLRCRWSARSLSLDCAVDAKMRRNKNAYVGDHWRNKAPLKFYNNKVLKLTMTAPMSIFPKCYFLLSS